MAQFLSLCFAPFLNLPYKKFVSRKGMDSVSHLRRGGTKSGSGMVRMQPEKMAAVSTYGDTHTGSDRP